ncbi:MULTISPECIES: hypothetical protein [unclassified Pseudomonas]|uniref:hypothetical protein n=1 Tax=unclassified Pseudomonas TaxID=196821 RepID=UPI001EFB8CDA|nr:MULTISPECIES: hypothetical protein [unclassified Pseudomonas]MCG8910768.1 hypothetical protein [Pseudomonas sp. DP-17]MDU4251973.1 hypothetical protein [Pseudomonas sp.]
MGAYITVAGWLQLDQSLPMEEIEGQLKAPVPGAAGLVTDQQMGLYRDGWMIQPRSINSTRFVFFGAQIRTHALPYIRAQVEGLARLVVQTDDYAISPSGYFLLTEDGTHGIPETEWLIEDGKVIDRVK